MPQTHAVLRIRRNGDNPQNTLFIVNYNKEDIEYYYRTLRYLERLDEVEEEEEEQEQEEQEELNEEEPDEVTQPTGELVPETTPSGSIDGSTGLAVAVGGILGIYLLIFLLWLGQFGRRATFRDDGEL